MPEEQVRVVGNLDVEGRATRGSCDEQHRRELQVERLRRDHRHCEPAQERGAGAGHHECGEHVEPGWSVDHEAHRGVVDRGSSRGQSDAAQHAPRRARVRRHHERAENRADHDVEHGVHVGRAFGGLEQRRHLHQHGVGDDRDERQQQAEGERIERRDARGGLSRQKAYPIFR